MSSDQDLQQEEQPYGWVYTETDRRQQDTLEEEQAYDKLNA